MMPFQDWNTVSEDYANFKIGRTAVKRNPGYSDLSIDIPFFRHPEGTIVEGYPVFTRYGTIRELPANA